MTRSFARLGVPRHGQNNGKQMEEEKVYIFISHSHKDIEKVRLVRNYLENRGSEPILFFLKSVTDDNEVADLIKREIDARLWFLYCRSDNAERSNWVRTELEYIRQTGKQNCMEIDLDKLQGEPQGEVAEKLNLCIGNLKTLSKVFVCYMYKGIDAEVAEKLIRAYKKFGIKALIVENFAESVENILDSAAPEEGLTVCLISRDYLNSDYGLAEMEAMAMRCGKKLFALIYNRYAGDEQISFDALPDIIKDRLVVPIDCSDCDAAVVALMNASLKLFGNQFLSK